MARRIDLSKTWLTTALGAPLMAVLLTSSGCGSADDFAETTLDATDTTVALPSPALDQVNNPSGGGASLNLPRVAWEGGPSYYSAYSHTDAAAWDNPAFFPIGVWFEGVYDQSDVDLDKDAGINTYVWLTGASNMPLIKQNGSRTGACVTRTTARA